MKPDDTDSRPIAETVIARLRALRDEHPDAQVTTELVRLDDVVAVVRAAIVLPGGGSASGFGASSAGGHEAVEEAETRALSRSLTVLGYGAGERVSAPVEEFRHTRETPGGPAAEPGSPAATAPEVPRPAPVKPAAPSPQPTPSSPAPAQAETAAATDDEPPLEDYSWTAFWNWARKLGYQNKPAVEELIGQSITSLNPAQVRNLIREKTGAQ
jgi:hypothetical protein